MKKFNLIASLAMGAAMAASICAIGVMAGCDYREPGDLVEPPTVETDTSLKVMSYNIRTTYEDRGDRLKEVIDRNDPDLLGLQEVSNSWQPMFKTYEGYTYVGGGRDDGVSGEACYILYKTEKFTHSAEDSGTLWFNPDPTKMNVPYTQTDSYYRRIFTYALLTRIEDGREFLYVNTHMPLHWSSRKEAADILINWLNANYKDVPTIITGDFNTDCDCDKPGKTSNYPVLNPQKSGIGDDVDIDTKLIAAGFSNARLVAPKDKTDSRPTYPTHLYSGDWKSDNVVAWGYDPEGDIIDYCMVRGWRFEVNSYKVDRDPVVNSKPVSKLGNDDASDHYPIVVEMTLK